MPEAKEISRNCAVCGDEIKINVDAKGHYDTGHYFGIKDVPAAEAGKDIEIRIGKIWGKPINFYKLSGKIKRYEYWECNLCYAADQRADWLENRIRKWYKERCPDFDPTCGQCEAWLLFDKITKDKSLRGNFEQEYDKEADKKYIYVKPKAQAQPGEAVELLELSDYIYLNLDKDKNLLGIEILRASKHTPKVFRNKDLKEHVEKLEHVIQK
jgi:uncharacterized protein YuzE